MSKGAPEEQNNVNTKQVVDQQYRRGRDTEISDGPRERVAPPLKYPSGPSEQEKSLNNKAFTTKYPPSTEPTRSEIRPNINNVNTEQVVNQQYTRGRDAEIQGTKDSRSKALSPERPLHPSAQKYSLNDMTQPSHGAKEKYQTETQHPFDSNTFTTKYPAVNLVTEHHTVQPVDPMKASELDQLSNVNQQQKPQLETVQPVDPMETSHSRARLNTPQFGGALQSETLLPADANQMISSNASQKESEESRARLNTPQFGGAPQLEKQSLPIADTNQMNIPETKPQPNVEQKKAGLLGKIRAFFASLPELFNNSIQAIVQFFIPNKKEPQEAAREEDLTHSQVIAQQKEIDRMRGEIEIYQEEKARNGNFHPGENHHDVRKNMENAQSEMSTIPVGQQPQNPQKSNFRSQ